MSGAKLIYAVHPHHFLGGKTMKKILAVLLALSMLFAFAACGGNNEPETTTAPVEESTDAPVVEDPSVADPSVADPSTADPSVADPSAVDPSAAAPTAMPEGTEAIVAYFNTAINGVKTNATSVKRLYSKISLNGATTLPSAINGILKLLGGADKFLGDQLAKNSKGEETYTGAQIKAVFPVEGESYASQLTAADVKSATIAEKDGKWIITITTIADGKSSTVKHGQGHAPKAFNVVLPGIVNDNIPGVATSIVGTATMNYPSSTVKVTVDPTTGKVLNATYDLKWTINFDDAGVIIPFTTLDEFVISY